MLLQSPAMKCRAIAIAGLGLCTTPIIAQGFTLQEQFQPNSPGATLYADGSDRQTDGLGPLLAVASVYSYVDLVFRTGPTDFAFVLNHGSSQPTVSRAEGAFVTTGGQMFNLSTDDGPAIVDLTEDLSAGGEHRRRLTLPVEGVLCFQMLVEDRSHVDGYRLSAPLAVRFVLPRGGAFDAVVDLATDRDAAFAIADIPDLGIPQHEIGPESANISPPPLFDAFATLTIGGEQYMSRFQVDRDAREILVNGDPAGTLNDLFAGSLPTTGVGEFYLETGYSVALSGDLAALTVTGTHGGQSGNEEPVDQPAAYPLRREPGHRTPKPDEPAERARIRRGESRSRPRSAR